MECTPAQGLEAIHRSSPLTFLLVWLVKMDYVTRDKCQGAPIAQPDFRWVTVRG